MNTRENTTEYQPDWHDALIDRGLTEIVGGETPPDLSERILAAAKAHPMNAVTLPERTVLRRIAKPVLAFFATAACLFVAAQLLLPGIQAAREATDPRAELLARAEERTPDSRYRRANKSYSKFGEPSSTMTREQKKEKSGFVPKSNMGLEGIIHDAYRTPPLSETIPIAEQESDVARIEMAVTPRIIIEGERLSKVQGDQPAPAPYFVDERNFDWQPRRQKFADVDLSNRSRLGRYSEPRKLQESLGWGIQPFLPQLGTGPGTSGDQYTRIHEKPFITAKGGDAVSTFSIDVDTASYANVRQFLQTGQLPPPDAVRIEELINYFHYDYQGPKDDTPFAANMEVAACPWNNEHRLARIAIKGKEIDRKARPLSNLVFLIDVSGSMNEANKLPLLVEGMKLMTRELGENDKVSIVVYASSEGLSLPSTRGDQQQTILAALDNLRAGGSTAGGAGINLAYQVAKENFIDGGVNRVILCTDGDFNVGVTSTADLQRLAEQKARDTKVFLTVLGFGRGNLNDAMMEAISNRGNGNYHYVDNLTEARKVLVEEMSGTLVTIAKDVKIQVEFNPAQVAGYRLIGYENRMLRNEDFNDDKKDAGEIGAGHTVTALYEIVPAGKEVGTGSVDPLKYQSTSPPPRYSGEGSSDTSKPIAASDELLTLKLRYKLPDNDTSTKVEFPITEKSGSFADASKDVQFAAAVASFGMLLRDSGHRGNSTFDAVLEIAQAAIGEDPHGYRGEFLELARIAKQLVGEQNPSTQSPSTTEGP